MKLQVIEAPITDKTWAHTLNRFFFYFQKYAIRNVKLTGKTAREIINLM